jgi:hypothetical protein
MGSNIGRRTTHEKDRGINDDDDYANDIYGNRSDGDDAGYSYGDDDGYGYGDDDGYGYDDDDGYGYRDDDGYGYSDDDDYGTYGDGHDDNID